MTGRTIYTIGHSNKDVASFIELLKKHSIEVVVDVRSSPYSRYASQFNKREVECIIPENGMKYLFMGKEIRGKPSDPQFYDHEDYVLYSKIAETSEFKEGIERLLKGIKQYKVALMCSEENPAVCHRRLLIGKVLSGYDVEIMHIRSDGTIQSEEDIRKENYKSNDNDAQQSLFGLKNKVDWKSLRPVSK